jgi:hypothetical protein
VRGSRGRLDALAHVGAAHVRQEHVEQNQVDAARLRRGERVNASWPHEAFTTRPNCRSRIVEELGYPAVVVDDEEGGG